MKGALVCLLLAIPLAACEAAQDAKKITFDAYVNRAGLLQGQRLLWDAEVFRIKQAAVAACLRDADDGGWDKEKYEGCITFAETHEPELLIQKLIKDGVLTKEEIEEILNAS